MKREEYLQKRGRLPEQTDAKVETPVAEEPQEAEGAGEEEAPAEEVK